MGADQGAGSFERRKVGAPFGIDRRRHRDDKKAGLVQRTRVIGKPKPRLAQRRLGDLSGRILAVAQGGDPMPRNVKPDDRLELLRQGEGDGKTDIAEADDRKSAFHERDRLIHLVVLLVPLHKSREPDFDRGLRLEAEIAARGFDIRKAFRDITGL